ASLVSVYFFFSSRRRHTRSKRDWSSDVCSSDLRAKATVQVKVAFRSYDARVLPEMSAKVHFLPRPSRVAVDTQPVLVVPGTAVEIGRASCRERGEGWEGGGV